MDNAIETIKVNKDTVIEIHQDQFSESPRDDSFGKMVCFSKRDELPHEADYRIEDYNGWEAMEKAIVENEKVTVILPVYMIDHSGLAFNTTGFGCPWDSGQVGFIFVSKKEVEENFGKGKGNIEKAKKILVDEVETYSKWSKGEVYGYVVKKACPNCGHYEEVAGESCWGFYGMDDAIEAGKETVGV